jgi:spermidine synthase
MMIRRNLLILFFLSGVSTLIYQVVWARELDLVFGVTAFAVATVVSSFMAGLSLGSLYFGRLVDRYRNHLRLFALLEVGIGVFALLFPFILSGIISIHTFVYQKLHVNFYVFSLIRFFLCFVILIIPTSLMGGTLPVLSKYFIRRQDVLGRDVGNLYSVNNLGAVIGCLAAGFILIPRIGVRETLYLAVLINFIIAGNVLLISRNSKTPEHAPVVEKERSNERERTIYPKHIIYLVLGLFGFEGFIALVYEVVWIRMLSSLVLSNSVYSFSIVTATFITGLTIGGYLISRFIDRIKNPLGLFAIIEVLIGLSALLLLRVFTSMPFLFQNALAGLKEIWGRSVGAEFIFAFLAMIVPATLMGAVFPLVSRICATDMRKVGEKIGTVGFFDTIGSVMGPFAAGFIFIYFIGMQRSIIIMALLNLTIGIFIVAFHPVMRRKIKLVTLSVSMCVFAVAFIVIPENTSYWRGSATESHKLLVYEEAASSVVTVTQKESIEGPHKFLEVNGIDVAGTSYQLRSTQKVQAHLPLLLYEASTARKANTILQVGLGSGETSWSAMLHRPEEMVCVELQPSVLKLAKEHFKEVNHGVFDNPAYEVVIEDGRNYMLISDAKYDVILTESIHPVFAGNANLYSKEYFGLCRKRLTEEGIVSIWLPLWALSLDDFRMVINTFYSVFPHSTVWYTTNFDSKQVHLIGSIKKLSVDFSIWEKRIGEENIKHDLREVRLDDPYKLLDALVMTEEDVEKYIAGAMMHTENRPNLEFSAPKSWYETGLEGRRINLESIAGYKKNAFPILDSETAGKNIKITLSRYDESSRHIFKGLIHYLNHEYEDSLYEFRQAKFTNPVDRSIEDLENIPGAILVKLYIALGEKDLRSGIYERAILAYTGVIEINPDNAKAYNDRGLAYIGMGYFDRAIRDLSKAIDLAPVSARTYINRGIAYTKSGLYENAIEDFSRAIELEPDYEPAYRNRSFVYEKLGRDESAERDLATAQKLQLK